MSVIKISNCKKCDLGINARPHDKLVLSEGNPKAKLMLVGEAPGLTEAAMGRPFVGRAGDVLNELLALAGIKREEVYVANICKCLPWKVYTDEKTGERSENTRTPEGEEIRACLPYLKYEIDHINPRVIIPLGGVALSALEGRSLKITSRMGVPSLYRSSADPKERIYILPTLHPSYVSRNGGVKAVGGITMVAKQVVDHLKYAVSMLDDNNLYLEHKYMCVDSREKLEHVLGVIKEKRVLAFDIETTGLGIDADILGLGIGVDVGKACYIPFLAQQQGMGEGLVQFWDDKDITESEVVAKIKEMMEDPTIKKSAHNAKFDMRGLHRKKGINVKGLIWDTMCGAYLIDENASHGLETLSGKYIDLVGYTDKWDIETNGGKEASKASLETTINYCCGDCDATYRETKGQINDFANKPSYMWFMDNFYVPAVQLVKEMELYGVLYDIERAKRMSVEYSTKAEQLKKDMVKYAGCNFDPNKGRDIQKVLFGALGLTHPKRTKTQQQSTDDEVLEDLAKKHPVPKLIMDYRHACKMRSTYIEGFIEELDANNRIHININPTGTVTGRLSSEGLMNIPRESDIKSLILVPEGHLIVQGDLSQAEVRVFTHYAKEDTLIKAFDTDELDVHCMVAAQIKNMMYEDFFKGYKAGDKDLVETRQAAKTLVFGLVYGRGPASIAVQLGISVEEATAFTNKFFGVFPKFRAWISKIHQEVESNGQVTNIFGRIRRIPAIFSNEEDVRARARRQAVNSIVQSTASDITTLALIKLQEFIVGNNIPAHILFTVYDSILVETPTEHIPIIKTKMKEYMEAKPHPNFTVRMKSDIDLYSKWGVKADKK